VLKGCIGWYRSETYHLEPANKPWESTEKLEKDNLVILNLYFGSLFVVGWLLRLVRAQPVPCNSLTNHHFRDFIVGFV